MIYLIDTIGTETGMHLYDQSFQQTIGSQGACVTVLSNYQRQGDSQVIRLFPNFYHGGKLLMMLRFAWSLLRMLLFYLGHHSQDDVYVYQSFGLRTIDQLFIRCLCGCRRLYVIVHDIFEITGNAPDPRQKQKMAFYNRHIPHAICHSRDTERDLIRHGYEGRTCFFPHFSYTFSKQIDLARVAPEVRQAIAAPRRHFLFFGQVRETKGIILLQEAIDLLATQHPDFAHHADIIIAGMDKGELITHRQEPSFVTRILRYMDDSELNYLFARQPYVLLPYTEIYQSGVLEVVIYFRCPAIMSSIPFFRSVLADHPSFGHCFEPLTAQALADMLYQLATQASDQVSAPPSGQDAAPSYFQATDLEKYQQAHDPSVLIDFLS